MRMRSVQVSYGVTANAGQYNSERFDVQLAAELDSDDDEHTIAAQLADRCRYLVRYQGAHSDNPNVRRYFAPKEGEDSDSPF